MSTQPTEAAPLVLRNPIQLVASIPYLLGFVPESSVVLTFVDGAGAHLMTVRSDLPVDVELSRNFAYGILEVCGHAISEGASSFAAVIYPADGFGRADVRSVISDLADMLAESPLAILSVHSVRDGICRDELFPELEPTLLAESGVAAKAEWVGRGATYQESRDDLATWIRGADSVFTEQVGAFIEAQSRYWERTLTRNKSTRRAIEDDIVTYIEGLGSQLSAAPELSPQSPPSVRILASWLVALADSRVREPVLWRLAAPEHRPGRGHAAHSHRMLDTMCLMLRNAPDRDSAPLASCVGAFSWQLGNGAMAEIAANYGLAADPGNVLCRLVREAVQTAVHPKVWVEMLQGMTLNELRAGPRRQRHIRYREASIVDLRVRDCPG